MHRTPIAYSIVKMVEDRKWVTSTLSAAVAAARKISRHPSRVLDIVAWFEDGTQQTIPFESLVMPDQTDWIGSEAVMNLENTLFPTTMRDRITQLLRQHAHADYWERVVLRLSEALLAQVDEALRGIPVEEAGLEGISVMEWENFPSHMEVLNGIPAPKWWNLYAEAERRLGFTDVDRQRLAGMSANDVDAEYTRRRAELRA